MRRKKNISNVQSSSYLKVMHVKLMWNDLFLPLIHLMLERFAIKCKKMPIKMFIWFLSETESIFTQFFDLRQIICQNQNWYDISKWVQNNVKRRADNNALAWFWVLFCLVIRLHFINEFHQKKNRRCAELDPKIEHIFSHNWRAIKEHGKSKIQNPCFKLER